MNSAKSVLGRLGVEASPQRPVPQGVPKVPSCGSVEAICRALGDRRWAVRCAKGRQFEPIDAYRAEGDPLDVAPFGLACQQHLLHQRLGGGRRALLRGQRLALGPETRSLAAVPLPDAGLGSERVLLAAIVPGVQVDHALRLLRMVVDVHLVRVGVRVRVRVRVRVGVGVRVRVSAAADRGGLVCTWGWL